MLSAFFVHVPFVVSKKIDVRLISRKSVFPTYCSKRLLCLCPCSALNKKGIQREKRFRIYHLRRFYYKAYFPKLDLSTCSKSLCFRMFLLCPHLKRCKENTRKSQVFVSNDLRRGSKEHCSSSEKINP